MIRFHQVLFEIYEFKIISSTILEHNLAVDIVCDRAKLKRMIFFRS